MTNSCDFQAVWHRHDAHAGAHSQRRGSNAVERLFTHVMCCVSDIDAEDRLNRHFDDYGRGVTMFRTAKDRELVLRGIPPAHRCQVP